MLQQVQVNPQVPQHLNLPQQVQANQQVRLPLKVLQRVQVTQQAIKALNLKLLTPKRLSVQRVKQELKQRK